MNTYVGKNRRQVGGGIFSTIIRGLKPILQSLKETLKPIGKKVAKRVAKSAVTVGSHLVTDALAGKIDKSAIKNELTNEAKQLSKEGFKHLKRKLGVQEGEGSSRKRRRISPKVSRKPGRKSTKRKSTKRQQPKKFKQTKAKSRKAKSRKAKGINKKQKTKRKKIVSRKSTVSRKAIKDLFG